jgi:hypothetical protein
VDVNGDGAIDILSGSYSRHEQDMAGLFQVLRGSKDGTFARAEALTGSDGEPLIITAEDVGNRRTMTDRICTRPFAVDFDGDGKLDIVSGNFAGTFALFRGEGQGKFSPKSTWLTANDEPLRASAHSDPFVIDWDGDGDLDLLTGSAEGGAYLFENVGTRKEPKFGKQRTLLEPAGHGGKGVKFGDAHVTAPQSSTRLWADDLNGDGKLDLLIGDMVSLMFVADGLDEASARKGLGEWEQRQRELLESNKPDSSKEEQESFRKAHAQLREERAKIVRDDRTGFVWVMYRK